MYCERIDSTDLSLPAESSRTAAVSRIMQPIRPTTAADPRIRIRKPR